MCRMKRLLVAIVILAALATACGSSSSSDSSAGTSSQAAPGTEQSRTAEQVLADARSAATSAHAVHISGHSTDASGPFSLDLHLSDAGGTGALSFNGSSFKVIRIGNLTYFTGDAAFWHEYVGSAAAAKLLTSKWLKVPSNSSGYKSLAAIADMDRELRTDLSPEGTVSKGTIRSYHGQPVIDLHDSKGGELLISATGTPYPIAIVGSGDQKGTVTFTGWNTPVTVTAPANAIDLQQLHDLAGQ